MNYSYGTGQKVYGKDITEARYNALLETFYSFYPDLQKKIKLDKNYFERDPNTAQLLEKRVLGETDTYIPDEDQDLLDQLESAYRSTKLHLEICTNQTSESACKSLKFKGLSRCKYEKKWFSYLRGGNCFIDEGIITHILSNLQSVININWKTLRARTLDNGERNLPNPDEFTKMDMINILHDLTYHIKSLFKEKDLITVLEEKHGQSLVELDEEDLLYYVYIFSFIVYVSQFLTKVDFQRVMRNENVGKLQQLMNNPPSKKNLINFIVFFFALLPPTETHKSSGWNFSVVTGTLLALLLLGFLPAAAAMTPYIASAQGGSGEVSTKSQAVQQRGNNLPISESPQATVRVPSKAKSLKEAVALEDVKDIIFRIDHSALTHKEYMDALVQNLNNRESENKWKILEILLTTKYSKRLTSKDWAELYDTLVENSKYLLPPFKMSTFTLDEINFRKYFFGQLSDAEGYERFKQEIQYQFIERGLIKYVNENNKEIVDMLFNMGSQIVKANMDAGEAGASEEEIRGIVENTKQKVDEVAKNPDRKKAEYERNIRQRKEAEKKRSWGSSRQKKLF